MVDNTMEKMLQKGDELRPKYENFDWDKLDSESRAWLNRLTWFSRHRPYILKKFQDVKVSADMKILYIE